MANIVNEILRKEQHSKRMERIKNLPQNLAEAQAMILNLEGELERARRTIRYQTDRIGMVAAAMAQPIPGDWD